MKKTKLNVRFKTPGEYSKEERKMIVEEYLNSNMNKQEIWYKYTGYREEKGSLIKWMRQLGYDITPKNIKLAYSNHNHMSNNTQITSPEIQQLKEKIETLEKALLNSELRATALDTMIEVAEKELKINIKKKSFTKQSSK
jgi:hypothetical protein